MISRLITVIIFIAIVLLISNLSKPKIKKDKLLFLTLNSERNTID